MFQFGPAISRRDLLAGSLCFATAYLGRKLQARESREVAWLNEIRQAPQNLPKLPALSPLLVDSNGARIADVEGWQQKRAALRRDWLKFLGDMQLDLTHTPSFKVLREDEVGGVRRKHVEYEIEPGVRTEAYVLAPGQATNPMPGVAVFHSTVNHSILQPAGLGADSEKAFGLKLAQRGYVTIAPRNFLWPDNNHINTDQEVQKFQERHPGVTGMAKMLYDSIVAVNILAKLPGVDANRLGAVGHSLGAKEVLYLAAFDDRIRATVSSEGGIGTKFSNWDAAWYLGPTIKEPTFRHEHHELLGMVAPRAFLLIGGESADGDKGWPYIDAALAVYRLYGDEPRIGQFNHRMGHAVPPICEQRIYEWLETYL